MFGNPLQLWQKLCSSLRQTPSKVSKRMRHDAAAAWLAKFNTPLRRPLPPPLPICSGPNGPHHLANREGCCAEAKQLVTALVTSLPTLLITDRLRERWSAISLELLLTLLDVQPVLGRSPSCCNRTCQARRRD